MLDSGDDPPVLFAWLQEAPWVEYADSFSDAVYAQVFDWQLLLEFGSDAVPSMRYSAGCRLGSAEAVDILRTRWEERVTTRLVADGEHHLERRFEVGRRLRLVARHWGPRVDVEAMGDGDALWALERELASLLDAHLLAPSFSSVFEAMRSLGALLLRGDVLVASQLFVERPVDEITAVLVRARAEKWIDEPIGHRPHSSQVSAERLVGEPPNQVLVRLVRESGPGGWWQLNRLDYPKSGDSEGEGAHRDWRVSLLTLVKKAWGRS